MHNMKQYSRPKQQTTVSVKIFLYDVCLKFKKQWAKLNDPFINGIIDLRIILSINLSR